jgi:hypothetical protein
VLGIHDEIMVAFHATQFVFSIRRRQRPNILVKMLDMGRSPETSRVSWKGSVHYELQGLQAEDSSPVMMSPRRWRQSLWDRSSMALVPAAEVEIIIERTGEVTLSIKEYRTPKRKSRTIHKSGWCYRRAATRSRPMPPSILRLVIGHFTRDC